MIKTISAIVRNCPDFRLVLAAVLLSSTAHGQTITKCQDEDGKWHYGDFASEACAKGSTITEIDQRGVKVRETDAPPTEEELKAMEAEKREKQLEEERRARQQEEDQRLLRTYDNAQSILDAREEHVTALDRDLESYRLFRQDLVDELEKHGGDADRVDNIKEQIQQYDDAIEKLQKERGKTVEEYDRDLKRYRELTEKEQLDKSE